MADISQEIDDFKNAIYGEEVRDSMVSLAQKLNTEVEGNTTNVNQAVETANSASSAANQAVQDANTTLQAANQAVQDAAESASAAAGSASAAAGSAENAAESATAASGSASAAAQSAANAAEVAEGLGGFTGAASSVTAQDVEGLLGSPGAQSNVQALIDAIADQVLNRLVKKSQIINNLLATQAGNVLDATQGKALKDLIDQLNSDLLFIKTKQYEISLMTDKDPMSSGYNGWIGFAADNPSGTILAVIPVTNGFKNYESSGFTASITGTNLWVTSPTTNTTVFVTLVWIYKI